MMDFEERDEVDKHHPVQHERGVPFPIGHVFDAFNESQKGALLLLETFVELFGDLLHVKGGSHPA